MNTPESLTGHGLNSLNTVNGNTKLSQLTGSFENSPIFSSGDTFSILEHLDSLNIVKETAGEYHCTCPLCNAGGFKIDKKTGRYFTFACGCMDTDQGKKAIIQAIAPLERQDRYYPSLRRQTKPKAKAPKFPPIEGTVTLAKFEVIPTDSPQPVKPPLLPQGVPDNATQTTYRYSPTQFIKRFDWEDPSKAKGRDKTFRQCFVSAEGDVIWGKGNDPWPLYRESEVIAAKGWPSFQEGEICVDTARCTLGLVSATLQGSSWAEPDAIAALTRLKEAGLPGVVFVADNDKPGQKKADTLLSASAKTDFPVIVIPITQLWENAPEKGDLADWIQWGQANGMNQDDFIQRLETEIHNAVNQRQVKGQGKPIDNDVEQVKILIKQWLLEDDIVAKALTRSNICRVYGLDKKTFDAIADSLDENSNKPKAKVLSLNEFLALPTAGNPLLAPGVASMGVTIFAGNPGAGKTTLAYDLAGAVLMGDEFLGEVPSRQGSVLFVNCDESHQWGQDKLINRGIAGHVPDDKATIILDWDVSQWSDLEMTVEDMRPALVIVDSFNAIHNDPNFDENSAQASQTAKKLERLSAKYCVPIVLIHHLGKSKDNKGVNKLRGSTAIAASVSSIILMEGEGTQKRLHQPKIRGSEPLDLTVEMDCENGRFRVTGGNVTDDATKSLKAKLIDFFAANPGVMFENSELRDRFPGIERKTLTNALNKILGTAIGNGKIIKRPSKVNRKFKVYGLECITDEGLSPYTPLSLSSPSVNSGDYEAETITTQSLGVVTSLSPNYHLDCHHLEDNKTVMITKTFTEPDCHLVTTESHPGDERVPPVTDNHDAVLTFDTVETAPIIEVEIHNNCEFENQQIVGNCQQNSEPTKTEPSFRFKVGDRVISRTRPDVSLEVVWIDSDGEWCCCKDDWGIELHGCCELVPDDF